MKLSTYSLKGIKKDSVNLPKQFEQDLNLDLLAQAIRVYNDRLHPRRGKTKTRGEVNASTRKIYRQKGTGYARHGANSAPIFVGGGIAQGPRGIKRELILPTKMRRKALQVALSLKAKESALIVVDGITNAKKTNEISELIKKISAKEENVKSESRITIALSEKNRNVTRIVRNLKNVSVLPFKNLNALTIFLGGVLIVDKDAFDEISSKPAKVIKKVEQSKDQDKPKSEKKSVVKKIAKKGKTTKK